jgi:hypothetical protein
MFTFANSTSGLGTFTNVVGNTGTVTDAVQTTGDLRGSQRSMVDSIVYTFSSAVTLGSGAFSIADQSGVNSVGINPYTPATTTPTLSWTTPGGGTTGTVWIVTFSGTGVTGGSIPNGVYDITLNGSALSVGGTASVASATDVFHRLFGDYNGTNRVTVTALNLLNNGYGQVNGSSLYQTYLYFDPVATGHINTTSLNYINNTYETAWTGFTNTLTN